MLLLCGRPASSQEIEPLRSGTLVFTVAEGEPVEIPRLHTEVDVEVDGSVAHVELRQRFRNPSDQWAEAIYAFPLPANARIERLNVAQNGKLLAAQRYAVNVLRNDGMQRRPALFRTALGDIAPGATVDITIAYSQTIEHVSNRQRLLVPLAVNTGRLPDLSLADAEPDANTDEQWLQIAHSDIQRSTAATQALSVRISLADGVPITSITSRHHAIQVAGGQHPTILANSTRAAANADFELEWLAPISQTRSTQQARATPSDTRLLSISNMEQ